MLATRGSASGLLVMLAGTKAGIALVILALLLVASVNIIFIRLEASPSSFAISRDLGSKSVCQRVHVEVRLFAEMTTMVRRPMVVRLGPPVDAGQIVLVRPIVTTAIDVILSLVVIVMVSVMATSTLSVLELVHLARFGQTRVVYFSLASQNGHVRLLFLAI